MSKKLLYAAKLIKEECSKHDECEKCFYECTNEEGLTCCIIDTLDNTPSMWNLSELEEKND